jgi:hypothetical protein
MNYKMVIEFRDQGSGIRDQYTQIDMTFLCRMSYVVCRMSYVVCRVSYVLSCYHIRKHPI